MRSPSPAAVPLACVTGNPLKWQLCQQTLGRVLAVEQVALETPELQCMDVKEIAAFSACWAAKELQRPVVKSDVGYYVEALNGFPGPLVKWVHQTLAPHQLLAMLPPEASRVVIIREALVYATPAGTTLTALVERPATLLPAPVATPRPGATLFDQMCREDGLTVAFSQLDTAAQLAFLVTRHRPAYRGLAEQILALTPTPWPALRASHGGESLIVEA